MSNIIKVNKQYNCQEKYIVKWKNLLGDTNVTKSTIPLYKK